MQRLFLNIAVTKQSVEIIVLFFGGGCLLLDDNCRFPADWNIPEVKTYKQDFLDKFPDADFNADCICRKYVYPNSGEHTNCNNDKCEKCWDKTYIEGV